MEVAQLPPVFRVWYDPSKRHRAEAVGAQRLAKFHTGLLSGPLGPGGSNVSPGGRLHRGEKPRLSKLQDALSQRRIRLATSGLPFAVAAITTARRGQQ